LNRSGVRLLGAVLNRTSGSQDSYYYYDYAEGDSDEEESSGQYARPTGQFGLSLLRRRS
jgi:hypothetical protein